MHHRLLRIFLLAVFLLNGLVIFGQDLHQAGPKRARTLEDYQPSTLGKITAMKTDSTLLPLLVKATYTGLTRPLAQNKAESLRAWANRYAGSVDHYTAHYKSEIQFIENGVKYWLAVTTKAPEQFQALVKKGQSVDLYLIRIGGHKPDKHSDWLLLVEKFGKSE